MCYVFSELLGGMSWSSVGNGHSSEVSRLAEFVLAMTGAERVGGRVKCVSSDRLELFDCARWTHHYMDSVLADFPDVCIDMCSCRQSLSGFAVIFHWRRRGRVEAMWYIAIALGLTSCAYALFTSPWWGAYRLIQGI